MRNFYKIIMGQRFRPIKKVANYTAY